MMDGGDDVGMVLSPQCFSNLNQDGDIFNHSNIHFWECAAIDTFILCWTACELESAMK